MSDESNLLLCAPSRVKNPRNGYYSCFTYEELKALQEAWNKSYPKSRIVFPKNKPITNDMLWQSLHEKFSKVCKTEDCWLENKFILNYLERKYPKIYHSLVYMSLKPKAHKNRFEWLSSMDIDYILKQYEEYYSPYFWFMGSFPIDAFDLYPNLFNLTKFKKYKYIGLVFNLDKSHQAGSHWVALFFDRQNQTVDYFDSTGDPPPEPIVSFLDNFNFKKQFNNVRHQKGSNECGMYSIYFILNRLKGFTLQELNQNRIKDRDMNKYRNVLFRKNATA